MKKVSVIVPVFNVELYLEKCIDSLVVQTYENIEILLVDDGSTDLSKFICDKYSADFENITVIHKKNGGLTSARKAGFLKSTGDYICFVDGDDYLHPDYVKNQVENLEKQDADISICSFSHLKSGKVSEVLLKAEKSVIEKKDFVANLILPAILQTSEDAVKIPNFLWLRLFKREVIDDSCFVSERRVYTEDIFFNLYAYDKANRVALLNKSLYFYRISGGTLTSVYRENKWDMEYERYLKLKNYCDKRKIKSGERFYYVLFNSVVGTAINEARLKDYNNFSKKLTDILKNKEVLESLAKIDTKRLSKSDKIALSLLKKRMIRALYLFERIK
jgi:glycosyltransferase involved in cell wall biosynthesis